MGRKAAINPPWLVSLMCRWSARQLTVQSGALGYPKKSAGFSEKITGGYDHSTPHDFSTEDYTALESALRSLQDAHKEQFTTMMMYYKPWVVTAMIGEGWPFGNSTYFKRLHAGHAYVAAMMDAEKMTA